VQKKEKKEIVDRKIRSLSISSDSRCAFARFAI